MKTIIKILITLVVLTACFNASRAAFNNYTFEDSLKELLLHDQRATDKEIVSAVLKLANQYDLEVDPKDINIRQVGQDVVVDLTYTKNVTLIPRFYSRDWTFTPSASTKILVGGRRQ